jgi:hypothetical protein
MAMIDLMEKAKSDLKLNGFVGMDYNMAVICSIAKRTGTKVQFMQGDGKLSYEEKLEYWSRKRDFCHLHVGSEEELLKHAAKEYNVAI